MRCREREASNSKAQSRELLHTTRSSSGAQPAVFSLLEVSVLAIARDAFGSVENEIAFCGPSLASDPLGPMFPVPFLQHNVGPHRRRDLMSAARRPVMMTLANIHTSTRHTCGEPDPDPDGAGEAFACACLRRAYLDATFLGEGCTAAASGWEDWKFTELF